MMSGEAFRETDEESNVAADERQGRSSRKRIKKRALTDNHERGLDESARKEGVCPDNGEGKLSDGGITEKRNSDEVAESPREDPSFEINGKLTVTKKKKFMERLVKEGDPVGKCGICYLSRIPPHMDHVKLRQILSQYGEIKRIYLAPEDPSAQIKRKRGGGFRGTKFSEGWVEFAKRTVAKRVANMLNGEQLGGRKRSVWFYDIWNIKYLSKFKWDDLQEEIALKNAIREQKLAMELSAAKRERDFYLAKVDQSRALAAMEERQKKKKQKVKQATGENSEGTIEQSSPKVIRHFRQKQAVVEETKSRLSREVLAGVFGAS